MNVRDKINELTEKYLHSLDGINGDATVKQQEETGVILDEIRFYTTRLMLFGNTAHNEQNNL